MAYPTVSGFSVKDIRFPTSLEAHGSDAMHTDPDYSCAYVIVHTSDNNLSGHGLTFTTGNGTQIVVAAINGLLRVVKELSWDLETIFSNFGEFWRKLTSDSQMRWLGPEKGVMHLATGALVNAYWDLWAKIEKKPLWKLLVDMSPEQLVNTIDWRYMSDALTKEEAVEMLKKRIPFKERRIEDLKQKGYPVYITSAGWLGYSDEKLCQEALSKGFTRFKAKVGKGVEEDLHRLKVIREEIGPDRILMTDANQVWDVEEAVDWMKKLAEVKPLWIEEPTSPDDIMGHAYISEQLKPYGIGVATGEMCQNRVMFKQFLKSGGMQFCQIDTCRLGGVNENIAVMLMAEKLNIPVCPHAGGVGLCEMVMHLSMFYYCSITDSMENSTEMTEKAIEQWEYPTGSEWQKLFAAGTFKQEY
ncbi:hypothetical protein EB796_023083 [Bugula neritina]|uniref:Mandelate racemase/muconate lactonizing enzyme C-terminal domain-containing protein n=1 Tax=Bugula neritina TaxID=10212 RepID=A0A7J7IYW6_BUGNE|nr:hypothetical protein EB796_023083 [Bugula neritina]